MSALLLSIFVGLLPLKNDSIATDQTGPGAAVYIDNIFIIGNKKTKSDIILREMSVQIGQTYEREDLYNILDGDKSKLLNTRLFNTVEITLLDLSPTQVDVVINVTERWYTFPVPIFDLVDRNFNDWWQNQDRDLSRTNYGVKIYKNNFRGRNETVRLLLQLGFTRQFGLSYRIPYIDKNKKHGLSFEYDYAENKNIAVRTRFHKPVFFDSDETLRVRREYSMGYQYRRSFYNFHYFEARYNDNTVSDTVITINPEYNQDVERQQKYAELVYNFVYDRRDFASYPLKGSRMDINVRKQGLGIHNDVDRADFFISYARYFELSKSIYFANYSALYASLPQRQPYSTIGALGFRKNFIRGYELYLIEGKSYYLNRSTIKARIFSKIANLKGMPIEQFRQMPIEVYFKLYFDQGYVENFPNYEFNQTLADKYLFGTGAGFDIVSYYDTVIRLEYSFNAEQEAGFFLHLKKEF